LFDCEKERVENVLQGMHFIDAAPVFLNPRRTSHNKWLIILSVAFHVFLSSFLLGRRNNTRALSHFPENFQSWLHRSWRPRYLLSVGFSCSLRLLYLFCQSTDGHYDARINEISEQTEHNQIKKEIRSEDNQVVDYVVCIHKIVYVVDVIIYIW